MNRKSPTLEYEHRRLESRFRRVMGDGLAAQSPWPTGEDQREVEEALAMADEPFHVTELLQFGRQSVNKH